MGFKIDCPNCGARSYHEFVFGGEFRVYDAEASEAEDYAYTWLRENGAGWQRERWFHFAGCRRWLTTDRDTTTNTVGNRL